MASMATLTVNRTVDRSPSLVLDGLFCDAIPLACSRPCPRPEINMSIATFRPRRRFRPAVSEKRRPVATNAFRRLAKKQIEVSDALN
jgi:hypothetical protein